MTQSGLASNVTSLGVSMSCLATTDVWISGFRGLPGNCDIFVGSSHFFALRPHCARSRNGHFRTSIQARSAPCVSNAGDVRLRGVPELLSLRCVQVIRRVIFTLQSDTSAPRPPPGKHGAMSRDISGCHTVTDGVWEVLLASGGGRPETLLEARGAAQRRPTTKNDPAPDVHSAEVEKVCFRFALN